MVLEEGGGLRRREAFWGVLKPSMCLCVIVWTFSSCLFYFSLEKVHHEILDDVVCLVLPYGDL